MVGTSHHLKDGPRMCKAGGKSLSALLLGWSGPTRTGRLFEIRHFSYLKENLVSLVGSTT